MNLSAPFVRRPVATTLSAAALLLAGAAAYTQLPVAPLPRVDFPTIQVSAALPGGSPATMASSVATPLERRLGRIAGLTEMTSASTLGTVAITLQFDLDRNVDGAARDVQAAINASLAELPPGLPMLPTYRKVNPADAPILILSLTSPTLPLATIYDQANTLLAQRISRVPGVGQVFIGGGQQPAVRVQVDPVALAGRGLTLADVRGALATATVAEAKGSLSNPTTLRVLAANDQLFDPDAFRALVIADRASGVVRLGDVATVFDDVENNRVAAWTDGRRAVLAIIRREPGANVIATIARVRALLPGLAAAISPAIQVTVVVDRAETIRASVRDVGRALVLSSVLVVLVVSLFLRSARASVIPGVAVPLSLVGTFGVMYLLDYSLDNLSLMALTISTGFVIDDAIVVTENVARHVEAGTAPRTAALEGARQIGFTIVSITASLLAVFIPILLMGGLVGRLFREFAVTLSVAIALSAVVSLTVTPAMCARLLRPARVPAARSPLGAVARGLEALQRGYARALDRVLAHRTLTLVVAVGTVALNAYLAVVIPKGLFPQQDTGLLVGATEAPQDISFRAMRDRQEHLNAAVQRDPDVDHVAAFIGAGPGGATENAGSLFVSLRPHDARRASADEIITRLRGRLAPTPEIALYLQSLQDVRLGGRAARTQYQYTLEDADLAELNSGSPRVAAALRALPELRDVASDQQNDGLALRVAIDRDSAARLGVYPDAVDAALYDAFGQRQVAVLYSPLSEYHVVLEAAPAVQARGPDALGWIYVRTTANGLAPLTALATATPAAVPLAVNHQGQFPAVTLSFNLAPGVALGQAVAAIDRAERAHGRPAGMQAEFRGTAEAFRASLATEPTLVLAALVAVYLVLGVLYESFVHPITILSTLPSAGVGALAALLVCRVELSLIALIGIVLLIGIVKKNAIMMVDFALEAQRREGRAPHDAIRQACLLRFRPIMMTTLAALLGALPLALGRGTGAELRRPLGIAIVGGLLASQLLTLFTTPVVYLALDRFTRSPRAAAPARPDGGAE